MFIVKSPLFLKWFYPTLTWNKSRSEKIVYLTFDDGPIPNVTDFVLNTLNDYQAKGTFFCIGDNIIKHPEQFKRIQTEGHAIGNHTFNHLKGWKTADESYVSNFLQCQELIQTNLFRPPYGRIKKSQIKKIRDAYQTQFSGQQTSTANHQLQIVMWDVLSGDFDTSLSPEKCYQNVIQNTENGSIIVFHDSLKAFERLSYILPKVLKYLTDQGYQFGVIS